MLLDYINKVVQIWLLATTGISAITTTIIMIEYSFVIVTDLKKKKKKQEVLMKNLDLTIRGTTTANKRIYNCREKQGNIQKFNVYEKARFI